MKDLITTLLLLNKGTRRIVLPAHMGLMFGATLMFTLYILGSAAWNFANMEVMGSLPGQELAVGLRKKDMSMFRMNEPGSATEIGEADLQRMRHLEGVVKAHPIRYGNMPAWVDVNFMGTEFDSELVIQGFDPEWIGDDVNQDHLQWKPGGVVPIIVNTQVLAIYNSAYAKSQGLPELSASALSVPLAEIIYGDATKIRPVRGQARVVGLSPKVALGAAIPNDVLLHFHQRLGVAPPPITEVVLRLDPRADTDEVRKAVEDLGFVINQPHPLADVISRLHELGQFGVISLFVCLCLFAFAYLNQTMKILFLLKQGDYHMCRIMGMSLGRLRGLLIFEVGVLMIVDLLLGIALGQALASGLNTMWLNEFLLERVGSALVLNTNWIDLLEIAGLIWLVGMVVLVPRVFVRVTAGR